MLRQHGSLNRKDVDELLWNKLPDWMNDKQRKTKINNLLSELRRKVKIENKGSYTKSKWVLVKQECRIRNFREYIKGLLE